MNNNICRNQNCNNSLSNMRSDAKYCSTYCSNNQKHLDKIAKKTIKICENRECQKNVDSGRRKFCSDECMSKEKYRKKAEKELESRDFKKCSYFNCDIDISKMKKDLLYCCEEHRLLQNRDKAKERANEWYKKNKDRSKKSKKDYYLRNKEKLKQGIVMNQRERRKSPINKLKNSISCSIRRILKTNNTIKSNKTEIILGCSYEQFKEHIESKFESWMTWENYGKYNGEFNYGWDIDHIIPLSTALNEDEIYKLNYYSNLQPLCSKINRDIKKDKLDF